MRKIVLKCGLIGGVIVFFWSMFSWRVLSWHQLCFHAFSHESDVQNVIKNNAHESGVYFLPNMYPSGSEGNMNRQKDQKRALFEQGPVVFASVHLEGGKKGAFSPFLLSLITQIAGGWIIAWMLLRAKIKEYTGRVVFVTVVGFLIGLLGLLPSWTWWNFSACHTLMLWADLVIGWFLAGLVMAKLSER